MTNSDLIKKVEASQRELERRGYSVFDIFPGVDEEESALPQLHC